MSDGPLLHIDFETRSTVNLKKTGRFPYAMHPTTDLWCVSYAYDDQPVRHWRRGRPWPVALSQDALVDHIRQGGRFAAHNAGFEIAIWTYIIEKRYGHSACPDVTLWDDTAAMAAAMAFPRDLKRVAMVCGMPVGKDLDGHKLMMKMSKPRKVDPDTGEITWWDDPALLDRLVKYCDQDVEAERWVEKRLYPLSQEEYDLWVLDQKINTRGVYIDLEGVTAAKELVRKAKLLNDRKIRRVTNYAVGACSQVAKLKAWVNGQGVETETLDASAIETLMLRDDLQPDVREALRLRQENSKSSTAKLDAMLARRNPDGRCRENLLFCGAGTRRWAGVGIQLQNMIRNVRKDHESVIAWIKKYAYQPWAADVCDMVIGSPGVSVSQCLRPMIVASPGRDLLAADFSNIEGRVLAWLAGETWKIKAFEAFDRGEGPDLYLVAAAAIYNVAVETLNKESPERQIGKVSELACGFGGGVGAFQSMAKTQNVVVPDEQADEIKVAWRQQHRETVAYWYDLEEAAINAVRFPGEKFAVGRVAFKKVGPHMFCQLPSGGALCYPNARIDQVDTPWGEPKDAVTYETLSSYTKQWERTSTYGGKLAENVTQATARDVMAAAMMRVEAAGYPIVLTVHDEIVAEPEEGFGSENEFCRLMEQRPAWADGLPVVAEGWRRKRYGK